MKELIKYMVQAMVDHPEQVEVSEVEGNRVSVLELKVAKADMVKITSSNPRKIAYLKSVSYVP